MKESSSPHHQPLHSAASSRTSARDIGDALTVAEILERGPRLGIPHFQRGRVWGVDNVSALLESLYYDTPCGSLVLWKSNDNDKHGVHLGPNSRESIDWLIVDGQQRIRSLLEVYCGLPTFEDDESFETSAGERGAGPKVWCVNLTRVDGFRDVLTPRQREFDLFVFIPDPRAGTSRSLKTNILPLSAIRDAADWRNLADRPRIDSVSDVPESEFEKHYSALHRRVREMEHRRLLVAWRGAEWNLAEMTRLFNRINAGGKQVDADERAFAHLVGLQSRNDTIIEGLKKTFVEVRKQADPHRNVLLDREEERAFGFRLFLRVFLQVCQYHLGYRARKAISSFDVAERDDFRRAFGELKSSDVEGLWDDTRRVVTTLRAVLDRELYCDDLRFLPDALNLMPIAQALIVYPPLSDERYRPMLAVWCLSLQLADAGSRQVQRWVAATADPRKLAFDVVPNVIDDTCERALKGLRTGLSEAESTQNRYVLLLYWLQRKLGAKDFRYDRMVRARKKLDRSEHSLCKAADPQKQHIVPFSVAAKAFGPETARAGSHRVHAVGNLTYISCDQNGLDALGDDFADLGAEADLEPANARAHFLVGEPNPLPEYLWLVAHAPKEPVVSGRFARRFNRWTERRTQLIEGAFHSWLDELVTRCRESVSPEWPDVPSELRERLRLEPILPRHSQDVSAPTFIRRLGLDSASEDNLIALCQGARLEEQSMRLNLAERSCVWLELTPGSIRMRVRLKASEARTRVFQAIGIPDPGEQEQYVRLQRVPDLRPLVDYCQEHSAEIIAARIKGKGSGRPRGVRESTPLSSLPYSKRVRDAIERLDGKEEEPKSEAAASIYWRVRSGRKQILRLDAFRSGDRLRLKMGHQIAQATSAAFPDLKRATSKGRPALELKGDDEMLRVLTWLGPALATARGRVE